VAEVHMPAEEATQMAQRLLAAAETLGLPPGVVETTSSGLYGLSFRVPDEVWVQMVRDLATGDEPEPDEEPEDEPQKPKKKVGRPKKAAAAKEVTDGE